ncbi:MAG: hypothetical protein HY057_04945, partial [Rhodospirillales bacterium]|nr:hypothetical protein [Rhodospirillales bacterium]
AVAKKLFARAARAPVSASADLPERVAGLLARRCLDTLGLARRAGAAVSGFEQVRVWLDRGRAGVLIEAVEAAAGGRRKLNAVARDVRVVGLLTASELGAAFGRETTMHAALAQGRLADRFGEAADRLAGFRTMTDAAPHDGGAGN